MTLASLVHVDSYLRAWSTKSNEARLSKVCAVLPKPAVAQRLREHPTIEQLEQIPVPSTTLSLEVPKGPTLSTGFESVKLNLDVLAHAVLPVLRPGVDPSRLAITGTDERRSGKTPFSARSSCKAIEVFGAICQSARPLAYDGPFVGGGVVVDL